MMNTIGVVANSSSAGSSAGSGKAGSTSGAFAGMLVQVLDGSGAAKSAPAKTALPVGLIGIVGQLPAMPADDAALQETLALLDELVNQLNDQESKEEPDSDVADQLTALLAALQLLLGEPAADMTDTNASEDAESAEPSIETINIGQEVRKVVQTLGETIGKLSAGLAQGQQSPAAVSVLALQLQSVLESWEGMLTQDKAGGKAVANADSAQASVPSASVGEASAKKSETPDETAAAVATEVKKTAQPLREAAWRPVNAVHTETPDGESIEPQQLASSIEAEPKSTSTAPVWSLQMNDALKGTAPSAPQLPAQIPVQQFADQMEKFLVKQFVLTQGNGISEAKITLHPEHLGQVDIKIVLQNGQLTAQFVTEHLTARDLLENQLSQLRTALQGQGLQVDRMEVVQQTSSSAGASLQQDQRQSGSGGQGDGNNSGNKDGGSGEDLFEAELERTTFLREFGYGSSLNVTA
ncbi:flagellar hook-length control protein FliK [Cohnella faecalis]|uniref:Flagellar hook-length control protein FliK n=1 Tax=Cohnella faecalis TaxID=2315694 RepID=A0A398CTV0_9BACL|nr:flagellar hook-length control protein FliK [Cohnella faecalis]RIE03287.1 flagellar hook-length control protein FliK [Cohnella faecalis]